MTETLRTLASDRLVARNGETARASVGIAKDLQNAMKGEAAGDVFTRGRYATDASIYQIMPAAVAFPRDAEDVAAVIDVAARHDVPIIARGGGT